MEQITHFYETIKGYWQTSHFGFDPDAGSLYGTLLLADMGAEMIRIEEHKKKMKKGVSEEEDNGE